MKMHHKIIIILIAILAISSVPSHDADAKGKNKSHVAKKSSKDVSKKVKKSAAKKITKKQKKEKKELKEKLVSKKAGKEVIDKKVNKKVEKKIEEPTIPVGPVVEKTRIIQ